MEACVVIITSLYAVVSRIVHHHHHLIRCTIVFPNGIFRLDAVVLRLVRHHYRWGCSTALITCLIVFPSSSSPLVTTDTVVVVVVGHVERETTEMVREIRVYVRKRKRQSVRVRAGLWGVRKMTRKY